MDVDRFRKLGGRRGLCGLLFSNHLLDKGTQIRAYGASSLNSWSPVLPCTSHSPISRREREIVIPTVFLDFFLFFPSETDLSL